MSEPPLVLVSGMPGAGKSTLAVMLAERLFLPLVSKDPIKESLSRVHGIPPDVARSAELGTRAIVVMHELVAAHLDQSVGVVLECAFHRGVSEPEIGAHLGRARAVDVHCAVDPAVAITRFAARAGSPERHATHLDAAMLDLVPVEAWPARYGRLELGIPYLEVDTTDGYEPSVHAIVAWVEEQIGC